MNFNYRETSVDTNATANDRVIGVNTSAAVTVSLPSANSVRKGFILTIKDIQGSAFTNNITIARGSTDTIDGQTSLAINVNFASVSLVSSGATKWHIF
tara:strand:- start:447 stop:740 length:294 start_codon:yes stop_codon:yes gene_type:complete